MPGALGDVARLETLAGPRGADGWVILDANGEMVAQLCYGNYESDRDAAETIVRLVNAEVECH